MLTNLSEEEKKLKMGTGNFITDYLKHHSRIGIVVMFAIITEGKKRTTLIFHFTPDNSTLYLFYFTGYDKNSVELRLRFVNGIIPNFKYLHGL